MLIAVFIAVATTSCFGHLIYSSGPYRGKVIDAETKQPLAGAAVVAVWYHERPGLGHATSGIEDVVEVLTDSRGEFVIPKKTHVLLFGALDEPNFAIYYPGYGPYPGGHVSPRGEAMNTAFREHTVVELPRLSTRDERVRWAGPPGASLGVEARKIPNLIRLINVERQALGLEPIAGWRPLEKR